jgi:colanic acid biosynthesis glycosyl transferase WcaI
MATMPHAERAATTATARTYLTDSAGMLDLPAAHDQDPPRAGTALDVLVIGMHYAPERSGNAPYTTGMARALSAAGHNVRVITGYPHYPTWRLAHGYGGLRRFELDGDVAIARVRHPVPAIPTARRRVVMDAVFALHSSVVTGPRPDVVLAVSPVLLTVLAGLRWRRPGQTALGVVVQDLYSRALAETGMTSPHGARLAARLERSLLNRADGIAVVHENFSRNLAELGVRRPPVSVIRNWAHVAAPRTDRAQTRRRLGWASDDVIALHAGNMGVKQGLENLVRAARCAAEAGSRVRFVLMGDGNQRRRLERLAGGLSTISFRDPLPDGDFEDALGAADVLIVNEASSVVEMSAPSKLTSYFSAARPVVAATDPRSAAGREIERSGGGVCVAPGDADALHAAVLTLGLDPESCQRIGRLGKSYADKYLTPSGAARAYCEWIERLASTR